MKTDVRPAIPWFRLTLLAWALATAVRFTLLAPFAGLSFDDSAYAEAGRRLAREGASYWGDTWRPLATWFVAGFHLLRGESILNLALAFATLRSLGELFLAFAARRLFPRVPSAPLFAVALSASSFLGALYGRQHLASLLFSVPLALWLYARFLDSGHWRDWLASAVAAGLVFLSHYNTIPALLLMLGCELARQAWQREPWRRVTGRGIAAAALAFGVAMQLGKFSYGLRNELSFLRRVWDQISANQGRVPMRPWDGFLGSLSSWEGVSLLVGIAACVGILARAWRHAEERRWLALAALPLVAGGIVFLRVNFGFLSFPRLYVFALPFLWLAAAGALARVLAAWRPTPGRLRLAAGGLVLVAAFGAWAHSRVMARYGAANTELERDLRQAPPRRMVIWAGNTHLAWFFAGRAWCPLHADAAESKAWWETREGKSRARQLEGRIPAAAREIHLARPDLAAVCDLLVLQGPSAAMLRRLDERLAAVAPGFKTTDFAHPSNDWLPIAADEGGALSSPPAFFPETSPLPWIRVYDLRSARSPRPEG